MSTSLRDLSVNNDGFCEWCGDSRAEGAIVNGKALCRPHAQAAIWSALEEAAFCFLRYMGWEAFEECIEGVRAYDGKPSFGYVANALDEEREAA